VQGAEAKVSTSEANTAEAALKRQEVKYSNQSSWIKELEDRARTAEFKQTEAKAALRRQHREGTRLASLQDAQHAQVVDGKDDIIADLRKTNTKYRVVKFRLGKQLEQQQAARIAGCIEMQQLLKESRAVQQAHHVEMEEAAAKYELDCKKR
jgi:hypothetical protein